MLASPLRRLATADAGGDRVAAPKRIRTEDVDDIARRLRDGDAAALTALYDLVAGRAFGLALRILRDRTAAGDAVHDAFERLWTQRTRIDPGSGRVDALTLALVRRCALDAARGSRRRSRGTAVGDAFGLPDSEVDDVSMLLERGSTSHASVSRLMRCQPNSEL